MRYFQRLDREVRVTSVLLIGSLLTGCASVPTPFVTKTNESYKIENGFEYCLRLATTADSKSQSTLAWGIVTSVLASAGVVVGTVLGPDVDAEANWAERNRNTLVLGASALLAVPATLLLNRSEDGSTASADAGSALGLEEEEALAQCLKIRAEYVNGRAGVATLVREDLASRLETLRNLERETENKLTAAAQKLKDAEAAKAAGLPDAKNAEDAKKEVEVLKERLDAVRARLNLETKAAEPTP